MKKIKYLIVAIIMSLAMLSFVACTPSNTFKVTLVLNGGSIVLNQNTYNNNAVVEVEKDSVFSQPDNNPTKAMSIFGGWYKTSSCMAGEEFDFTTKISKDTLIYAKWISLGATEEDAEKFMPFDKIIENLLDEDKTIKLKLDGQEVPIEGDIFGEDIDLNMLLGTVSPYLGILFDLNETSTSYEYKLNGYVLGILNQMGEYLSSDLQNDNILEGFCKLVEIFGLGDLLQIPTNAEDLEQLLLDIGEKTVFELAEEFDISVEEELIPMIYEYVSYMVGEEVSVEEIEEIIGVLEEMTIAELIELAINTSYEAKRDYTSFVYHLLFFSFQIEEIESLYDDYLTYEVFNAYLLDYATLTLPEYLQLMGVEFDDEFGEKEYYLINNFGYFYQEAYGINIYGMEEEYFDEYTIQDIIDLLNEPEPEPDEEELISFEDIIELLKDTTLGMILNEIELDSEMISIMFPVVILTAESVSITIAKDYSSFLLSFSLGGAQASTLEIIFE